MVTIPLEPTTSLVIGLPQIMAYGSYADFLNALENAGELIRIKSPTATELEITEIADREMKKPDGGKAIYLSLIHI